MGLLLKSSFQPANNMSDVHCQQATTTLMKPTDHQQKDHRHRIPQHVECGTEVCFETMALCRGSILVDTAVDVVRAPPGELRRGFETSSGQPISRRRVLQWSHRADARFPSQASMRPKCCPVLPVGSSLRPSKCPSGPYMLSSCLCLPIP